MIISISLWKLLLLFLEVCASSLGFPGGMVTMIALGSLSQNISTLYIVILVAFIGAVLGDIIAYSIGRRLSEPLLARLRTFAFFKKNEEKSKNLLNKYGFFIIFLSRFAIINLCAVMSYVAGLEKFNRKKFISAVIFGEFLYAFIYSVIGYAIGSVINNLLNTINYVVASIIVLFILVYLIRYLLGRKKK
ncbi:MAG: DedA family protein [Candidatus Pacearchaeota archaeon]|nr:DedA family protein [Candidatus Pacearchaeota archaeon]